MLKNCIKILCSCNLKNPDLFFSEAFSCIGRIKSVAVFHDSSCLHPQNYGFVSFALRRDEEQAIYQLNGSLLDGCYIYTAWSRRWNFETRCKKSRNLIFIDCEMTGLLPEIHRIVEIAVLITDSDLNVSRRHFDTYLTIFLGPT